MLWLLGCLAHGATCGGDAGGKQLLWGDLHVHTAYSMDAYALGTIATPRDAYAFARGSSLRLPDGERVQLARPLDFAAVTDHADTFDVMYLCTDPVNRDDAYCRAMREGTAERQGTRVFFEQLLPIVAAEPGVDPPVCAAAGVDCAAAHRSQWQRIQQAANEADEPCAFTALIGYEWTATPGGRHWHRNVIFRSAKVPDQAFDYLRFPRVGDLWAALQRTCDPAEGCDVLAIPHNINWADGGGFDVEREPVEQQRLRARFERLAEIHQEKGNSECLPADPEDAGADCAFERYLGNNARTLMGADGSDDAGLDWQRVRSAHYRGLLGRGLAAYRRSDGALNPLMLGAIGSTDAHLGTPGLVAEERYWGSVTMLWEDDAARLATGGYNPGGLVAVWAEENTRAAIFDALQRRQAYATSGPRIALRFGATAQAGCTDGGIAFTAPMGSSIRAGRAPGFAVLAGRDRTGLAAVEIVKGEYRDGEVKETVHRLAEHPDGRGEVCVVWRDPDFLPEVPAYWYARVLELPTPRWTDHLCERVEECAAAGRVPDMTVERAWSSPVWHLPAR